MNSALASFLTQLDKRSTDYATRFVNAVLESGATTASSDIHLQPTEDGLQIDMRIDGVLCQIGVFSPGEESDVVARLKVLADLLTYKTDVPQEGRLLHSDGRTEMRVSTFPTLHGERAVVRLFSNKHELLHLEQLGLPENAFANLNQLLYETTGAILVTGPVGSGKTTTAYACLRHIAESVDRRSVVSLEDPIEVDVPGVAQSQVNPVAGFDLVSGLKSMLRQDPEVLMIGEMRDRQTAEVAIQASLTGQLVVTTFHAGSCQEALDRMMDMGIEPYMIQNGVLAVVNQRLIRKLCACKRPTDDKDELLGLPIDRAQVATGCDKCNFTGYSGRILLAEFMEVGQNELSSSSGLTQNKNSASMELWNCAINALKNDNTSPAEVRRVLGFRTLGT